MVELNEMLNEAGETFQQKETQIATLQDSVKELESVVAESQQAVQEATQRYQIKQRESQIQSQTKTGMMSPFSPPSADSNSMHDCTPGSAAHTSRRQSYQQALSYVIASPPLAAGGATTVIAPTAASPCKNHRQSSGFYEQFTDTSVSYMKSDRSTNSHYLHRHLDEDVLLPGTPESRLDDSHVFHQGTLAAEDLVLNENKEGGVVVDSPVASDSRDPSLPMSYSRFELPDSGTILSSTLKEIPPRNSPKKPSRLVAAARKCGLFKSSVQPAVTTKADMLNSAQGSKFVARHTKSSLLRMNMGSPRQTRAACKNTKVKTESTASLSTIEEIKEESKCVTKKNSDYHFFAHKSHGDPCKKDGVKKARNILGKRRSSYQTRNKKKIQTTIKHV